VNEEWRPTILDRLVELLARAMDGLGLNGRRLLWKWTQKRGALSEAGARSEVLWRSTKTKHKMCPACRALVPRSSRRCPECGAELRSVSTPGVSRLLANVFPGISAATALILLVNGFWFILMIMAQIKSGAQSSGLFASFGVELLVRFGAGLSFYYPDLGTGGEWWRVITPIFLHGGLLHFFFNSFVLLQLGPITESIYGTPRFWVIYLCCGIAGSATSQFTRPVLTVGASGAILGLMGLLLVYGWRHGGVLGQTLKSAMIRYGVYILVFSLLFPRTDHLNHLGGLLCGATLAFVVPAGEFRSRTETNVWQFLALAGVLLVLVSFYQVAVHGVTAG
jgi:rhomboid protease GluP